MPSDCAAELSRIADTGFKPVSAISLIEGVQHKAERQRKDRDKAHSHRPSTQGDGCYLATNLHPILTLGDRDTPLGTLTRY